MSTLYLHDVTTLKLDTEACNGCRVCLSVCPRGVFEMRGKKAFVVERDACIECGACALNCAAGALNVRAGVGCATAIINGRIGRKQACCVIGDDSEFGACC